MDQIERRIVVSRPPDYHYHLLTGHRGSGKSTELRRLQAGLERNKFLVAYVDVQTVLDLADIEYLDVLLAIAQSLDDVARRNNIRLNEQLLEDVTEWFFSEEIITREEVRNYERSLGADFAVGASVPLFAKMMATLTGKIRTGSTVRKSLRQHVERGLGELLAHLKRLTDNVRQRAQEAGYKGVVVIVDSLDKMLLRVVNDNQTSHALLFVEHAEQLRSIPCHIVYTFPASLLNDRNLSSAYDGFDILPMIKINTSEHRPWDTGRDLMYEVVKRRVSVEDVFEDTDLVYNLIDACGGVTRDLMHLLLFAADMTPIGERIGHRAVDRAIAKLVRLYDHLIHEKDLPLLQRVSQDPWIGMSSDLARLMYNRLVLLYVNGENWRDLHPAVRQASTFRVYLRRQGIAGG